MSARIIPFRPTFDPLAPEAEARYDRVVHRMNQLAATRNRSRKLHGELERQFVEDDLTASSGRRRGRPLTTAGRRRRLTQLITLGRDLESMDRERARLGVELEAMNRALDEWARRTYGLGEGGRDESEEGR